MLPSIYCNGSNYDSVSLAPCDATNYTINVILDNAVAGNINLMLVCKLLSIDHPPLNSSNTDIINFIKSLRDMLKPLNDSSDDDISPRKLVQSGLPPQHIPSPKIISPSDPRVILGFNVKSHKSPNFGPPKLSHISNDVMEKFFLDGGTSSSRGDSYSSRGRSMLSRSYSPASRLSSGSNCAFSYEGTRGPRRPRADSSSKIYEIVNISKYPQDVKTIVSNILTSIPPSEIEGRPVSTMANQMLNSSKHLAHLRQNSYTSAEIEKAILDLDEKNVIHLSKDKSRFGLVIPQRETSAEEANESSGEISHEDMPSQEILNDIWENQKDILCKATTYRSAVNILINSCSQIRTVVLDKRIRLAERIIEYYIKSRYIY
jgi:hypothetical protein